MAETWLVRKLAGLPSVFDGLRWILEGGYRGHRAVIRKHLSDAGRILDLGCGTGIYASCFAPESYLGADLSPEYVAAARRKFPGYRFEVQDACSTTYADGQFDACMISGVLHHLDDELASRMLGEGARITKRTGKVVIWEDVPARHRWNLIGHVIHRLDLGAYIRSPDDYRRLIEPSITVEISEPMRSGAMDYQVFVGRPR